MTSWSENPPQEENNFWNTEYALVLKIIPLKIIIEDEDVAYVEDRKSILTVSRNLQVRGVRRQLRRPHSMFK